MSDFVVTDPSGKEFVVSAPEGATQDQALEYAKTQFGGQQQVTPQPAQPRPGLMDYAGAALKGVGSEIAGGLGQLFSQGEAPEIRPGESRPRASAIMSNLLGKGMEGIGGIGRVLASPAQAIAAPGQMVAERVAQEGFGASPETAAKIGGGANLALSLLAPSGLINAIPNTIGKIASPLGRVHAAEQANAANAATNAERGQQYAKELADFEARQATAKQAGGTIAQRQPDLSIRSPIAESMRSTTPESEIYSRFNATKNEVALPVQSVVDKANEVVAKFQKDTVANAPSKAVKTAGELSDAASQELITTLGDKLARTNGSMTLADIQTNMQDLWPLIKSSDNRISAAGNQLYHEFTKALEASGAPGKLLLDANRKWRQNRAVDSLSEMIASPTVSKTSATNLLEVNPHALTSKIQQQTDKMDFIRGSFQPDEWRRLTDTIEHVFNIKGQVGKAPGKLSALEPTDILPAPAGRMNEGTRHGVSVTLGALAHALGMPGGWGAGYAGSIMASYVPQAYTNAIIKVAARPGGRALLERLYRGAPPSVADAAKAAALTRFLRATESPNGQR